MTNLLNQIDARYGRSAFFQTRICASFADGEECEVAGNAAKLSGSFDLRDNNYQFDGEGLYCNEDLLVTYNYSCGVVGVGKSLSIYSPSGDFLYALRPSGNLFSCRFTLSVGDTKVCEISRPYFFGMRFRAQISDDCPAGLALFCLWVAMTRMVSTGNG